jgi:hypothetical protein
MPSAGAVARAPTRAVGPPRPLLLHGVASAAYKGHSLSLARAPAHRSQPRLRRAAIAAPWPSFLSARVRRRTATLDSSLGPVGARAFTHCPGNAAVPPDFRSQQPSSSCSAVRARRRPPCPKPAHKSNQGEPLALLHTFPGREHRRLAGILTGRAAPWAKDPIAEPSFFLGS